MGVFTRVAFGLWFLINHSLTPVVSWADIFGADDRSEALYETHVSLERQAVAVGVLSSMIELKDDDSYEIETDNISDLLCPDERFSEQSSVSYACTGFLVGPDLLVTAGHCATHFGTQIRRQEELYCDAYNWVFDYTKTSRPWKASPSAVYKCKKVLYAVYDGNANQRDFALIQLDRPVSERIPLNISTSENKKDDSVFMLGHPLGMPMKYTGNARIITDLSPDGPSYVTNLDAFAGNSGSPVFNANHEVVGILVGGMPNNTTYYDEKSKCERYNRCDDEGKNCKATDDRIPVPLGLPTAFSEVQKINKYYHIIEAYRKNSETDATKHLVF